MEDLYYIEAVNDRKLLRNLEEIPDVVRLILQEKIQAWTAQLKDQVIENIRSRLKTKSGKLGNSVEMEIIQEGLRVEGRVFISGVPYAQAQDRGAVTPAHIIRPHNAKILAFYAATGNKVFAARVFHPGGVIPPTYYMKDAYRFISPKITRGIRDEVMKSIRAKMNSGTG